MMGYWVLGTSDWGQEAEQRSRGYNQIPVPNRQLLIPNPYDPLLPIYRNIIGVFGDDSFFNVVVDFAKFGNRSQF
jgi:hypothetical protein